MCQKLICYSIETVLEIKTSRVSLKYSKGVSLVRSIQTLQQS